jgi:pimeloyl-ACP methyl ester carboxylesterase
MIAQEAWSAYPEKIHGLVLSATSPAFGKPGGAWQQEFLAQRLAPLDAGRSMAELAPVLVAGMLGPQPDPAGNQLAIEVMARVPASTYRAALQALVSFDRRALLAAIAVPTLVLAAEHDANAPPAVMEKMAARIPGAAYVCLPGLGHLSCLENPPLFDAAVLDFLAMHFPAADRSGGPGDATHPRGGV